MRNKPDNSNEFLSEVFQHILFISKGECHINEEELKECDNEDKLSVLSGLKLLHEDLELYKADLKDRMESEYKLKILMKENLELEQFNYIASHDMKEPMRNIKNFTDLLVKQYSNGLDSKANQYLSFISDSSVRMYELIEGLLNYSTISRNNQKEVISCNKIIESILQDLEPSIQESNAEVIIADLPKVIVGKIAIHQLFLNLLTNCIKYKSPDRKLKVKVGYNHTDSKSHHFIVEDNGLGIEEEYRDTIFELFNRLHIKSEIEGTGIGLSICKKIIESLDGDIWVESEYGKGSTFNFSFPK